MTCRRADALIPAYLDGELTASSAAMLDAHLQRCDRCRRRLADSRAATAALTAARSGDNAPAPDVADLRARIAVAVARTAVRRALAVGAAAAALAGLVSAACLLRAAGQSAQTVVSGAAERPVAVSQGDQSPPVDERPNEMLQATDSRTRQRATPMWSHRNRPRPPAAFIEIPEQARLAWRAIGAVLAAVAFPGGEVVREPDLVVAVVVAWDDVLPEDAWNVPETSSYSAAVTLPNGDRSTLATETHPADPEAPIMVAATYEPRL